MKFNIRPSRAIASVLACAGVFLFTVDYTQAQTAPPVDAPPAAPVVAPTAVTTPPAPPVAPTAPTAPVVAPVAVAPRREDEVTAPTAPQGNAAPPPPSSLATRVTAALAAMRGQGQPVAHLAERDQTIQQLRAQLAERDQTIQQLTAENAQFRADQATITAALNAATQQQTTVNDTLAAIGFPNGKLPGSAPLEQVAAGSIEDLTAKMKAESDPMKRAQISDQIIALRDKAKK